MIGRSGDILVRMQLRFVALFPLVAIAGCATPPPWGEGCDCEPSSLPDPAKPSVGAPAKATPAPEEPRIVIDSNDECIQKSGSGTTVTKLDPERRLLVTYVGGRTESATRFDADKKAVASVYWGEGGAPNQTDYTFDVNDHLTEIKSSSGLWVPFFTPAKEPTYSVVRWANTYAENGRLVHTTKTSGSAPLYIGYREDPWTVDFFFEENASQQCVRMERWFTPGNGNPVIVDVEKRTYDEAGRLTRSDWYGTDTWTMAPMMSSTIWTYDGQGRLVQERWWRDGTKLDGSFGFSKTIEYRDDGSQRIVTLNPSSDTGEVGPFVTERSAYCAVIDAWQRPGTSRCAAQ